MTEWTMINNTREWMEFLEANSMKGRGSVFPSKNAYLGGPRIKKNNDITPFLANCDRKEFDGVVIGTRNIVVCRRSDAKRLVYPAAKKPQEYVNPHVYDWILMKNTEMLSQFLEATKESYRHMQSETLKAHIENKCAEIMAETTEFPMLILMITVPCRERNGNGRLMQTYYTLNMKNAKGLVYSIKNKKRKLKKRRDKLRKRISKLTKEEPEPKQKGASIDVRIFNEMLKNHVEPRHEDAENPHEKSFGINVHRSWEHLCNYTTRSYEGYVKRAREQHIDNIRMNQDPEPLVDYRQRSFQPTGKLGKRLEKLIHGIEWVGDVD